jgi:hypothetical protein
MNKLDLTKLGGDPFTLDNLEFLQLAISEAMNGLASVWQFGSSDSVVLSGMKTTPSGLNTTWTGGFVVINQEVFAFTGGTFPTSASIVMDVTQTIDTNGDEVFEDLSTQSTYVIRRGVLKVATGGPNEIDVTDFISLKDRFSVLGLVVNQETAWQTLPTLGATFSVPLIFITSPNNCQWRTNKLGEIEFRGILNNSNTSNVGAFTLPIGSRPTTIKTFATYVTSSTSTEKLVSEIIIFPSGNFNIYFPSGHSNFVSLDGVKFIPNI